MVSVDTLAVIREEEIVAFFLVRFGLNSTFATFNPLSERDLAHIDATSRGSFTR
jgi:hypothetical protein